MKNYRNCRKKKNVFFKPIPYQDYVPARLTQGVEWYISYYVKNPETGRLKRFRIKVNRTKCIRERRKLANIIVAALNVKLAMGWNPLIEAKAPRAYGRLFEALNSFLKIKAKETEENTMRSYRSFIKIFKSWLENHNFSEESYCTTITKEIALAFFDDIDNNAELSAKTYNNYLAFFRILFNWMSGKGFCTGNPFNEVPKKAKRLTKKRRRVLTDDELARLFKFLKEENPEYLAAVVLCYCCFIRPKELCMLRCRDIDLEKQLVHIGAYIAKNDNDSFRTIPNDIVPILRNLDYSNPDYYLFGRHNKYDFTPGKEPNCSRKLAKYWQDHIRKECNFGEEIQFYSLKDTGITNMTASNIPINLVQQQADHSSVAVTAIYVGKRASADEELKSVDILPRTDK